MHICCSSFLLCCLHLNEFARIAQTYKQTEYMWVTKDELISVKNCWASERGIAYCESLLEGAKSRPNPDKRFRNDPEQRIYKVMRSCVEGAYDGAHHEKRVVLIFFTSHAYEPLGWELMLGNLVPFAPPRFAPEGFPCFPLPPISYPVLAGFTGNHKIVKRWSYICIARRSNDE